MRREVVGAEQVERQRVAQHLELLVHVAPDRAVVGHSDLRAPGCQLAVELAYARGRERALHRAQALGTAEAQRDCSVGLRLPARRMDVARAAMRALAELQWP